MAARVLSIEAAPNMPCPWPRGRWGSKRVARSGAPPDGPEGRPTCVPAGSLNDRLARVRTARSRWGGRSRPARRRGRSAAPSCLGGCPGEGARTACRALCAAAGRRLQWAGTAGLARLGYLTSAQRSAHAAHAAGRSDFVGGEQVPVIGNTLVEQPVAIVTALMLRWPTANEAIARSARRMVGRRGPSFLDGATPRSAPDEPTGGAIEITGHLTVSF